MGNRLVPWTEFSQIEEGELARDLGEKLKIEQQFLIGHVRRWGHSLVKKDKVKITLEITIQPGEVAEDYLIHGRIKTARPGRPTATTRAIHIQEQTGEDVLVVRSSGSDDTSPREHKLFTNDGRAIDPESGDPKPRVPHKEKE